MEKNDRAEGSPEGALRAPLRAGIGERYFFAAGADASFLVGAEDVSCLAMI